MSAEPRDHRLLTAPSKFFSLKSERMRLEIQPHKKFGFVIFPL
jgi:hypothetical protein